MQQAINDSVALGNKKEAMFSVQEESINYVSKRSKNENKHVPYRSFKDKCFTCGKIGHMSAKCYKNAKCEKCKKIGHTANVCRKNIQNMIFSIDDKKGDLNYVDAMFCNKKLSFLVDSGAAFSIIDRNCLLNNYPNLVVQQCKETAIVADGRKVTINECVL